MHGKIKGGLYMKRWFKAASIRALKTLAQTAVATIGAAAVISEVDWPTVASAAVLAAILSYLTSIAGLPELDQEEVAKIGAERTDADRRGKDAED
jgi:hypothetical protein